MKKIYSAIIALAGFFAVNVSMAAQAPIHTIGEINHQDATTGVADSLNKRYQVSGTVYTGNQTTNTKLTFFIGDGTGFIQVFASKNFGYTPNEGDSVVVVGSLTQYGGIADCGQLEIKPGNTNGDTVYSVGSGTLAPPVVISTLDEAHESALVRVNGLILSYPTDWNNSPSGFSVTTNQGVRLYFSKYTTSIAASSPGLASFDAIGIISQYDTSAPYTSFYTLNPRKGEDILLATGVAELGSNALRAMVFPNPANNVLSVTFMAEHTNAGLMTVTDVTGKQLFTENILVTDGENRKEVQLNNYPSGLYLLKIKSGDKESTVKFNVVK